MSEPKRRPAGRAKERSGAGAWPGGAPASPGDPPASLHERLSAALAPVCRDLRATCPVPPDIREDPTVPAVEEGGAYAMFYGPDGSGQGVSVMLGDDPAEQVARLADQVQEWAVEALWSAGMPAVWPHCPSHPDSHPLEARVRKHEAAWFCPHTGERIAPVGDLPA
jgi:hypothetical protein